MRNPLLFYNDGLTRAVFTTSYPIAFSSHAMHLEPPSRIAILGAGPCGLETGLYARYLGYQTTIYEQGEIAQAVRAWGHVRMFSPFRMNRSPLGLAALQAQNPDSDLPIDNDL